MANEPIKDSTAATTGTVSYNGYTFPTLRQVTGEMKPEYDGAMRALAYNVYTFNVYFWIWASTESTLSNSFENIRNLLSQPGGALSVSGMGFGSINVSGAGFGNDQDVLWGPKPQLLRFEPLGGNIAIECWWTCQVAINDCLSVSQSPRGRVVAFNYEAVYAADERGLSTIGRSGYLQIANSRLTQNNTSVVTSPDDQWANLVVRVPPGFRRTSQQRKIDASRSRLDFQIVDTEIASDDALPPGITNGSLRFSIENLEEMNFQLWRFSISATMERLKGLERGWSYRKFFEIVEGTVRRMRQQLSPRENDAIIPLTLSIDHEKWGLEDQFQVTFQIARDISQILAFTQIWEPVESNFYSWAASMERAWTGGLARLKFTAGEDAIVDLCHQSPGSGFPIVVTQPPQYAIPVSYVSCDDVTEESSWLHYENRLINKTDDRATMHQQASEYTPVEDSEVNIAGQVGPPDLTDFSFSKSDTIQYHGSPYVRVCMVGRAVRMKFQPLEPKLKEIGGRKVKRVSRKVDGPELLGYNGPCPVYGLSWEICYTLTDIPAGKTKQSRRKTGPYEGKVQGDI